MAPQQRSQRHPILMFPPVYCRPARQVDDKRPHKNQRGRPKAAPVRWVALAPWSRPLGPPSAVSSGAWRLLPRPADHVPTPWPSAGSHSTSDHLLPVVAFRRRDYHRVRSAQPIPSLSFCNDGVLSNCPHPRQMARGSGMAPVGADGWLPSRLSSAASPSRLQRPSNSAPCSMARET